MWNKRNDLCISLELQRNVKGKTCQIIPEGLFTVSKVNEKENLIFPQHTHTQICLFLCNIILVVFRVGVGNKNTQNIKLYKFRMVEHKFYDFSHTFPYVWSSVSQCYYFWYFIPVLQCSLGRQCYKLYGTHTKKKRNIRNTERCMMIQNNNNTNNNIFLRYPIKKDCQ